MKRFNIKQIRIEYELSKRDRNVLYLVSTNELTVNWLRWLSSDSHVKQLNLAKASLMVEEKLLSPDTTEQSICSRPIHKLWWICCIFILWIDISYTVAIFTTKWRRKVLQSRGIIITKQGFFALLHCGTDNLLQSEVVTTETYYKVGPLWSPEQLKKKLIRSLVPRTIKKKNWFVNYKTIKINLYKSVNFP